MPALRRPRLLLWAAALLAPLLASGCGPRTATYDPTADYVAMGSSFAAGPGVGERVKGAPILCARSAQNYAHLLAAARHLKLHDVTCSGATIADILHQRQAHQPPQIEAVGPATRLVTITVGGNDVSYLGNLAGESCAHDRSRVPLLWRPVICHVTPDATVAKAFDRLEPDLETVVRTVHQRAPAAKVALLDYSTVLPSTGSCPAVTSLDAGQIARGNTVAARLSRSIEAAARATGATYVPVSRATAGHDACAADPWVFGYVFRSIPLTWGPFAYHPNDKGMRMIAARIAAALG